MSRPKSGYYVGDTKVPSVTTILGRYKEAGGLILWAYRTGHEHGAAGLPSTDPYQERDDAAAAGHVAHSMIQAKVLGREAETFTGIPGEILDKALTGYRAFLRWWEGSSFEVIATEQAMVSPTHLFGGTLDAIARDSDGGLAVLDWKTSKGRYVEYLIQLAAYRMLAQESHDLCRGGVDSCHLLWIDKETASFGHFGYTKEIMDQAAESFLHLRHAYEQEKSLKRLV